MISFPANTKVTIDEIRNAIGRTVFFYQEIKTDCPTCVVDPVTGESLDSFCPTCSGFGYLVTISGTGILAHVTQSPGDIQQFTQGGNYYDGDCRIQIEYTEDNLSVVDSAKYVIVDGKEYEIKKKFLRGVPTLNRVLIDLKQSL